MPYQHFNKIFTYQVLSNFVIRGLITYLSLSFNTFCLLQLAFLVLDQKLDNLDDKNKKRVDDPKRVKVEVPNTVFTIQITKKYKI